MKFQNPSADVFIPDGKPAADALARVTHLGIGAHQDDLEFMAFHGILTCFGQEDKWFGGVTCTSGTGSSRTGSYAALHNTEMATIRRQEQNKAAVLGRFGAPFTVFANATYLDLDGGPRAAFTSFVPKSGNWGATFSNQRVSVTARWNYRGMDRRAPQAVFGPQGYEDYKERITLDVNASYQLTRRLSLAASVNNLLNEPQTLLRYGPETPAYARQFQETEYGIQFAFGLRGTF